MSMSQCLNISRISSIFSARAPRREGGGVVVQLNPPLKHAFVTLARLLLLVSIAMATVPSWSKVTVCVIGAGKVTVPIGRCGMPCCARKGQAAPDSRKACCKPKTSVASAGTACPLASRYCRCETRYTVASARQAATFDRGTLPVEIPDLPAILPLSPWEVPVVSHEAIEPGVRGVDAGPPRKAIRAPKQSRAPPASV